MIGILLEVPSLSDVKIVAHAKTSPGSLPITPMKEVLASSAVEDRTRRVRVQGTITYYQPGSAAVLQNGTESLWISTSSSAPMRIGDVAVATGFPDSREGFLELSDAEITDSNFYEPVSPQPATWRQLATWNSGYPDGHQNDLVSFEGQVMTAVREDSQDEFVLSYGDKSFTAIFRHPPSDRPLPAMRQIPIGTKIRVTGICMAAQANSIATVETEVPFYILLRSFEDIEIVAKPSWLNVRNLTSLVGLLLALLLAGGARAWVLERKVRYQNAETAYTERRRSRILEDINGSDSPWLKLSSRSLNLSPSDCRAFPVGARSRMEPNSEIVPRTLLPSGRPGPLWLQSLASLVRAGRLERPRLYGQQILSLRERVDL